MIPTIKSEWIVQIVVTISDKSLLHIMRKRKEMRDFIEMDGDIKLRYLNRKWWDFPRR